MNWWGVVNKIALSYVLYGRFGIDLIASLPLEIITLIFSTDSSNLKFLGMLKMVRLLRLGRMITFLKANQKLKFSMKIGQLVFFILMTMHWINCLWYFVTESDESWYPLKDQDAKDTAAYNGTRFYRYNLFYYYSSLILVGGDVLPSDFIELLVLIVLIFTSTVFIGMVIGEFASLLAAITKKERMKSEEIDIISSVMLSLRLSESIQDRVFEFYDKLTEAMYIKNSEVYSMISPQLADTVKLYQIKSSVSELSFLNQKNKRQIELFWRHVKLDFQLAGDVIIKQGTNNSYFYFVWKGLVEVLFEHYDYDYYNHKRVERFIAHLKPKHKKDKKSKNDKSNSDDDSSVASSAWLKNNIVETRITNVFMEALKMAKEKQNELDKNNECVSHMDRANYCRSDRSSNLLSNKRKDSVEDSLEALVGQQSKKTAAGNLVHNPNFKKVTPLENCFEDWKDKEAEDSKSTEKIDNDLTNHFHIPLEFIQPFLHPLIYKWTKVDVIK